MFAMQIGAADLDDLSAELLMQIARKRGFHLRIGKQEDPLAIDPGAIMRHRLLGAPAGLVDNAVETGAIDTEG